MPRLTALIDGSLGLVSALAGAFVALVGIGVLALGVYGFIVGVHGGPIAAGVMTVFGAALAFVGCYFGRIGYRTMRQTGGTNDNPRGE